MSEYKQGLRDGIPIALGYFFVSFSFGITGVAQGLYWWEVTLISMTNLTSAGQFAGMQIILSGGSLIELAVSQLIINLRYSLMSISLSQKVDSRFRGGSRWLLGFGITDEIFGVSMNRNKEVSRRYFLGLMTLPYIGWAGGTLCGGVFGSILPAGFTEAMSIAIYGMFLAIIVPKAKSDFHVLAVTIVAIAMSCTLYYVPLFKKISVGASMILCALAASVIGAVIFPITETADETVNGKADETVSETADEMVSGTADEMVHGMNIETEEKTGGAV